MRASARCRLGCHPSSLPLNDFDHEDAETQYEDDEPKNDARQALFHSGDEVHSPARAPGER